jgi:protein-L-isoaspartate(D-aspartate) O-methyltransferase
MRAVPRFRPALILLLLACSDPPATAPVLDLDAARERLIDGPVRRMVGDDDRVIEAFRRVHRHRFLPEEMWGEAYEDRALRRPDGETVTAPDLTAGILTTLELTEDAKVLECGTRSGWLTALLATLSGEVFTVDARPDVSERAAALLGELGLSNVRYRVGDPHLGWPEEAPFDAVVINGVVPHIPKDLYRMLVPGGRILAPVGRPGERQSLILSVRGEEEPQKTRAVLTVRFVPLSR